MSHTLDSLHIRKADNGWSLDYTEKVKKPGNEMNNYGNMVYEDHTEVFMEVDKMTGRIKELMGSMKDSEEGKTMESDEESESEE